MISWIFSLEAYIQRILPQIETLKLNHKQSIFLSIIYNHHILDHQFNNYRNYQNYQRHNVNKYQHQNILIS